MRNQRARLCMKHENETWKFKLTFPHSTLNSSLSRTHIFNIIINAWIIAWEYLLSCGVKVMIKDWTYELWDARSDWQVWLVCWWKSHETFQDEINFNWQLKNKIFFYQFISRLDHSRTHKRNRKKWWSGKSYDDILWRKKKALKYHL